MLKVKIVGTNKISTMGADEVGDMALLASFAVCVALYAYLPQQRYQSRTTTFFLPYEELQISIAGAGSLAVQDGLGRQHPPVLYGWVL